MKSFRSRAALRAWLRRHHASEQELVMRLFKVHARHRGIGYREALDEALCFGWIDGVRRAHDQDSFTQRFTPRRARSSWSAVNVKRFRELDAEGRVHPAGRAAFDAWDGRPSGHSFESTPASFAPELQARLKSAKRARTFWEAQPPGYRRLMTHWVMSAKREATRASRFDILLDRCANAQRVNLLSPRKKP